MMLRKGKLKKREEESSSGRSPSTFTIKQMLHSKSTYFYRWGSRKKLSPSLTYIIPSVCSLALLVGGIITLNPIISENKAWADISTLPTGGGSGSSTGNTDTTPSIAISFPTEGLPEGFDNSENQVTTAKAGEVVYRSNIFEIAGTNVSGYTVTLSAAFGSTGQLKGMNNPDAVIGKVQPESSAEDFQDNTWGYAISPVNQVAVDLSGLTYNPVPDPQPMGSPATIANTKRAGVKLQDRYKLAFAAKFGNDATTDHYSTKITVSVVGDFMSITEAMGFKSGDSTIYNMQEMTSNICKSATQGAAGRLNDERDGKWYWVAKLADDKCWMTQNLAYDGGGIGVATVTAWKTSESQGYYYNPGIKLLSGNGTDVSDKEPSSDVNMTEMTNGSEYNAHYLSGNYYNWTAAKVACPAGWKLPQNANGSSDVNNDYYTLLSKYGLTSKSPSTIGSVNYNLTDSPIYFQPTGYMYINSSDKLYTSGNSYYWTSTSARTDNSVARVYVLGFYGNGSTIQPNDDTASRAGLAVRCVNDPSITE